MLFGSWNPRPINHLEDIMPPHFSPCHLSQIYFRKKGLFGPSLPLLKKIPQKVPKRINWQQGDKSTTLRTCLHIFHSFLFPFSSIKEKEIKSFHRRNIIGPLYFVLWPCNLRPQPYDHRQKDEHLTRTLTHQMCVWHTVCALDGVEIRHQGRNKVVLGEVFSSLQKVRVINKQTKLKTTVSKKNVSGTGPFSFFPVARQKWSESILVELDQSLFPKLSSLFAFVP